ncbi:glycosyltransferase family 2 protein [Sulfurimonas sp.]|uniref:glycosyltransferase family 2 protein n=1 Tax=Sulfurimonas sp. TaxID=2022749 RepID=UPI003569CB07
MISVAIIAKNAEKTIGDTLESLKSFDDVVVYDNGSTDNTKSICESYANVNHVDGEFSGFGPTKNKAASFCKNDWILSLDADEVLTKEFIDELKAVELDESKVYTINRVNYYKDQKIAHCWANDIIVRVYNKNKTAFNDLHVHEKVISDGFKVIDLKSEVNHFPYSTITDFIIKLDRYSTIFAEDNVGRKSSSPLKAILNAKFSFLKTYFIKRGFLDGYAGLVIAFSHMATNFYKYIKLYEANKELKK